ncbi:RICIN domain-containing protein [Streptomyces sp. NBC_00435]
MPSSGFVTATPATQQSIFQLINRHSGKAIDVPGASTSPGTKIIQYTPSEAVNQRFRFIPVGSGLHEVRTTGGLSWDISGGGNSDGARLIQWNPTGADNQRWKVTETGDGHITLTCARSGKVLGITDRSTSGTPTTGSPLTAAPSSNGAASTDRPAGPRAPRLVTATTLQAGAWRGGGAAVHRSWWSARAGTG